MWTQKQVKKRKKILGITIALGVPVLTVFVSECCSTLEEGKSARNMCILLSAFLTFRSLCMSILFQNCSHLAFNFTVTAFILNKFVHNTKTQPS